jgi:nicotinamidase-related amidase
MTDPTCAPTAQSALVLLDLQFDFLDDRGRMPVCRDHVDPVLAAARRAIDRFRAADRPVVAIGNEFRPSDRLMNLLRRHASIAGSPGAAWDPRVPREGLVYFPKWATSAFVNPQFEAWLRDNRIRKLVLGGLRADACVSATARAALAKGFEVQLLTDAIACTSDRTRARALERLAARGAVFA